MNLGIIGKSKGNGHPYSWSAIINGYDEDRMEKCGYESIPKYLKKHSKEIGMINEPRITHIWTQDYTKTDEIAKTTYIDKQCIHWNDMVDEVDGILLARDDSENHMKYAEIFLRAGIPIYIDKPIATSLSKARELLNMQAYKGQIFTCSALRYAKEFNIDMKTRRYLGKIRSIKGTSIKDWDKYSVHIIEPANNIGKPSGKILENKRSISGKSTKLQLAYSNIEMIFETTGEETGDIKLEIVGDTGTIIRRINDPFQAFKKSLETFVKGINEKKVMISEEEVLKVVRTIELGKQRCNETQ